jgi:hypothetical protein
MKRYTNEELARLIIPVLERYATKKELRWLSPSAALGSLKFKDPFTLNDSRGKAIARIVRRLRPDLAPRIRDADVPEGIKRPGSADSLETSWAAFRALVLDRPKVVDALRTLVASWVARGDEHGRMRLAIDSVKGHSGGELTCPNWMGRWFSRMFMRDGTAPLGFFDKRRGDVSDARWDELMRTAAHDRATR